MRRLAIILSIVFSIVLGVTSARAQQVSKDSTGTKSDSKNASQELAERMAEHLSRTLPEKLSRLKTAKTSVPLNSEKTKASDRPIYAPLKTDISVDLQGRQEQTSRPKITLPKDKPLGASGPSRDDKDVGEDAEFMKMEDRWRIGVPDDPRFRKGSIFNPYRQNILKGDYPLIGNDIFMNMTLASESAFVLRNTPIGQNPKNPSRANSLEFFGRGRTQAFNQNFIMSFDLFKGDASFKPVDWRIHIVGISNLNFLNSKENLAVNIDPNEGKSRLDGFNSIEEAFFEWRLGDTPRILPFLRGKDSKGGRSPQFDTSSMRIGIQEFVSDFRGFIFNDKNLGVRMFGNVASNRYQYNVAYFNMLEKETNSALNTVNFRKARFRDQKVYIANLYRQDTFVKGYTLQFSAHYNTDQPSTKIDSNGLIVRPAIFGLGIPHHIRAGYIGMAGDGHFGRINVSHAFYQAVGRDTFNGLAAKATRINAQMAAAEFSIDFDYIRYRVAGFYTSGDSNPRDNTARGFDAIIDNPNFAGGQFSFFNSNGLRLRNTALALVEPNSLIPSLRSSKIEGQSNFVNPGLSLFNAGIDADLTPKLRGFINYNYIRFNRTEVLEQILFQNGIRHELGHDLGVGFIYRPLLNENIIITSGASTLRGGTGFADIFTSNCDGQVITGCGASRPTPFAFFTKLKFQY